MDTGVPIRLTPGVTLCRSFSLSAARKLVEYRFFATACYEPIPPGQLRCEVCSDSGGPGQVLSSTTNATTLDYGVCSLSLPPVTLDGGGRYWMRLSHTGTGGALEMLQGSLMPFWAADHRTQVYIDGYLVDEFPRFAGVLVFDDGYTYGIDQSSAGSISIGINYDLVLDLVNPTPSTINVVGVEAAVVAPLNWSAKITVGTNTYRTDPASGNVALFSNMVSIPASAPFSVSIDPPDAAIVSVDGDLFDGDPAKIDSFLSSALFADGFKMRRIGKLSLIKTVARSQIMLIALRLNW
jgi:hypothetical protein